VALTADEDGTTDEDDPVDPLDDNPETPEIPSVRVRPQSPRWRYPLGGSVAAVTGLITRGDPPGIFATLAKHRRLFVPWLAFGAAFLAGGALRRADVELVILRTAWNTGSWYEWAQHVALGRGAGLPIGMIERIPGGADGPEANRFSARQRLLMTAADELHDQRVITDATWARLSAELSERQLIELCLLVGHYEMVAMTVNSLGVEPEASALRRLAGSAARTGDALRRRLNEARAR
jgi:alkylhydroperoxidase family enzyme